MKANHYDEGNGEEEEEDHKHVSSGPKKSNILPLWGNDRTMNLNPLILTNIQSSHYFKVNLYELKTYHEVIDEIYYKVAHLEPWEKGSRKTAGQTGMCGGVGLTSQGAYPPDWQSTPDLSAIYPSLLTRNSADEYSCSGSVAENGPFTHCDWPRHKTVTLIETIIGYWNQIHMMHWSLGHYNLLYQVRGVGAGGIVSTAYCLLYKLFTLKLTRKQLNGLITHPDSPYIRALGFMYIRYTQPPADLWDWYDEYLEDPEEMDVKAGGGQVMTIGNILKNFLCKLEWFSTLFPRIPVPIQQKIEKNMNARFPNGFSQKPREPEPEPRVRDREAEFRRAVERDRSRFLDDSARRVERSPERRRRSEEKSRRPREEERRREERRRSPERRRREEGSHHRHRHRSRSRHRHRH